MKIEQLNLLTSITFIIIQTISDFAFCFLLAQVSTKIRKSLFKKRALDLLSTSWKPANRPYAKIAPIILFFCSFLK